MLPYDSGDAGSGSDPEGDRSGTLTLPEYIYATYNELMKNGWRMKEIDEMDRHYPVLCFSAEEITSTRNNRNGDRLYDIRHRAGDFLPYAVLMEMRAM